MSALVLEMGGEARTTSVIVAEAFEKRHADVVRSVRSLLDEEPDLERNFALMIRKVEIGKGASRESNCYDMNRKGFMLLVMRFTGGRALKMQIAFIDQFDRMEALLRAPVESIEEASPPLPSLPAALETPDQFEAMRMKLRTVEAARMAFGAAGARKAWKLAGLPDLTEPDPAYAPALTVIAALHRSLAEWLDARTEAAPGHREETQALYADYIGWARDEGYAAAEILSLPAFGKALTRCNVASIRSNRMHRIGLRLAA